jgi:hypothetical protein
MSINNLIKSQAVSKLLIFTKNTHFLKIILSTPLIKYCANLAKATCDKNTNNR